MEYTNAISQFLKAREFYGEVKGANSTETFDNVKKRKAKFVEYAILGLCLVIAFIIALNFYKEVESPAARWSLIIVSTLFNVVFLVFYAIYITVQHSTSFTQEQFDAVKQRTNTALRNVESRASNAARQVRGTVSEGVDSAEASLVRTFRKPQ